MNSLTLSSESIPGLEALANQLALPTFDLLLVGDGSGTIYSKPAGWACVAYDRRKQAIHVHSGAVTTGTNNFAELIPYLQALWFHHQDHQQTPTTPVRVQIISDSELTVRCGNRRYARKANACLWTGLEWFEQNGYQLAWYHVPRNSNEWSERMDAMAGHVRRSLRDCVRDVTEHCRTAPIVPDLEA